jgi:DNA helicase-2/ATP-dependent DNA helicase PcrA
MQSKLLENLNKEQLGAVQHKEGPLLIVAGAGTGKTTVITRRIAYLIEQNIAKPEEILALTFTEKAAGEMAERVDLLLPLGYHDLWIYTFHGFCERVLKNHGLDIGLSNDFELFDETRQWALVYKNLDQFDLDYYRPLGSPEKFIDSLISHFSRLKDEHISPEEYLDFAQKLKLNKDKVGKESSKNQEQSDDEETEIKRIEEVANAYHTYQTLLLKNNALDFGDLIVYTLELFKKRPKILQFYQKQFKQILVDEFQDTNFAQFELVRLLSGDDQNLCVVGDDDQSIYKFRGASVSNILKFKESFPKASQITLVENYRSSQEILDLAYKFIQANNPDRLEVKLKIDKRLKANTLEQATIEVIEGRDLPDELNEVAKRILQLKSVRAPVNVEANTLSVPPKTGYLSQKGEKNTEAATWNDFAILIRANSAADSLLPVLDKAGIPYTFVSNTGLYKKPVVLDLLSYFDLLDNAHNSQALYRVLSLPRFHLSHTELSEILQYTKQRTVNLFEALTPALTMAQISEEGKKRIRKLLDVLRSHSVISKTATAAEMLVMAVEDLGIKEMLAEETAQAVESRELLEQFYKKIEKFEAESAHKSLHDFLDRLDLELMSGNEGEIQFDPNKGPESVKVYTVHAAKGLEFKYVFVINLVDKRFPSQNRKDPIEIPKELVRDILPEGDFHLQEERRLFYVALTRAKTHLFLTWAKDYGGKQAKKPSQFLVETGLVPSEKVSKATGKVVFEPKAEKLEQVYERLPERFSFTELKDFETCPLRYKYQHYLKLPLPGSQQMSFGCTIHDVLEEFTKAYRSNINLKQVDLFGSKPSDNPVPDFRLMEDLYQKKWVDDWYKNKAEKEKYRKEGLKMLKTFYERLAEIKPQIKFIEQFFRMPLGEWEFVGKIDRADEGKEGLEIMDYKTGKVPKGKSDLDQLYIYQWAVEEHFKQKVSSLKYWYLKDDFLVTEALATPEEMKELQARLLKMAEKIIHTIKYDLFLEEHKNAKAHDCEFEHLEKGRKRYGT